MVAYATKPQCAFIHQFLKFYFQLTNSLYTFLEYKGMLRCLWCFWMINHEASKQVTCLIQLSMKIFKITPVVIFKIEYIINYSCYATESLKFISLVSLSPLNCEVFLCSKGFWPSFETVTGHLHLCSLHHTKATFCHYDLLLLMLPWPCGWHSFHWVLPI